MNQKIAILILLISILVSCSAPRTEVPTQGDTAEDQDITVMMTYLAEDIDIGDGGLFSGQPCASPCAFGIHVGETQLDQVIPVLEKNGISRCWTEPSVSWSLVSCGANRFNVQVDMQTRLVNSIWFNPSVPIVLGDIVEKYGDANYVTIDWQPPDRIQPRLYWNSIRMVVVLPEVSGETYDIRNTNAVEAVSFSDENLYRISDKETSSYYKVWNGYGVYQAPVIDIPLTPMATVAMTP